MLRLLRKNRTIRFICLTWLISALLFVGLRIWTHTAYAERIYETPKDLPNEAEPRIAIVFGAGLWPGGRPSPVLYDRIATAAELYKTGKVNKLLLTGDNRFKNYNEPAVMRQAALELGVPDEDIVLDFAGRSTYESCFRAREIFGVRRAVLVTQAFHIDRAVYICDSLGIDGVGVKADRQSYGPELWWSIREMPATFLAWFDLNIARPLPVLGEKIPIRD